MRMMAWSILVMNPKPDEGAGQHHPPAAAVLDGPDGGVGRHGEQQGEQGVGVVEAEHQGGHRGEGHHRPGQQGGARGEPAAHGDEERAPTVATPSRAWGTRMLQELTPKIRAEISITHREAGRLVDGDEVGGVGRAEEEGLPALRAGLDGGRVEAVGPTRRARAPTGRGTRCPPAGPPGPAGPRPGPGAGPGPAGPAGRWGEPGWADRCGGAAPATDDWTVSGGRVTVRTAPGVRVPGDRSGGDGRLPTRGRRPDGVVDGVGTGGRGRGVVGDHAGRGRPGFGREDRSRSSGCPGVGVPPRAVARVRSETGTEDPGAEDGEPDDGGHGVGGDYRRQLRKQRSRRREPAPRPGRPWWRPG